MTPPTAKPTAELIGFPIHGGLTYREAHVVMETIAECGCMAFLEVAEVNPILDHKNNNVEFTAEIVASSPGLRILYEAILKKSFAQSLRWTRLLSPRNTGVCLRLKTRVRRTVGQNPNLKWLP